MVSTGSPELENLATHLQREGLLSMYVHPFIIAHSRRQSKLGRLISRVPRFGAMLDRRIGARGLPNNRIRSGAAGAELLRALLGTRFPLTQDRLISHRNRRMGSIASDVAKQSDIVVASFGIARHISSGCPSLLVLNMPNCHPAYQNEQFDEIERRKADTRSINMRNTAHAISATQLELDRAQAVLCGSAFVARTLRDRCPSRVRLLVAPYGVESEKFHPSLASDDRRRPLDVVSVATLTPHKGVLDLTSAFARIPQSAAMLTLYGSAPHGVSWIQGGSQYHGGRLTHHGIADRLRQADVMVLASWFEGLPLSVLEALASGLACIVTDRGGDEAVRDGIEGFVVPPGDPDAIRDAVMKLSSQPELLASMKQAARRRAEEMSWERYAEVATSHLMALHPRSNFDERSSAES